MSKQLVVALVAAVTLGVAAPAASAETVTANGFSLVKVSPADSKDNASIVAALEAAHSTGVPLAMANAREEAQGLASASGLTLGALQSVDSSNDAGGYYGPGGPSYEIGPFGPHKFCGTITRRVRGHDSQGRRITRRVRQRRCIFPRQLATSLKVTFSATRSG
jgi:hypothetical protein